MRILGIDPGTLTTGYGVIDSDGERHALLGYGGISSPKKLAFSQKLLVVYQGLLKVIEDCGPEHVVVEALFHAVNVKSALRLGHVRGVALLAGVSRGLPVHEYTPLEVKQAVVGYGRADKEQVQEMVKFLLGLEERPEPHDAADALATALCHAHRLRFAEKTLAHGAASSTPSRPRQPGR
ncbi:MAG: crossover junction endodeoxyribonuclease RuvC [Acidobacteriota bacterium]